MPDEYPPPGHVLRQLALSIIPTGEGAAAVEFPVWPQLCHPAGGVRAGVLVTAIDVSGGVLTARAVHPDWIATSSLSMVQRRPATEGTVRIDTRVLRAGRTAVVLGYEVADGRGPVAVGTMDFSRLHRREGNPDITAAGLQVEPTRFATDGPAPDDPIVDHVGLRRDVGAVGVAELDLTDRVRNSLGAVQGGMLGLVAEAAAESVGAAALGCPTARTVDLTLDYVAVANTGPVRGEAEVVRVDGAAPLGAARCRVEITDLGSGRLVTVALATVVPA